MNGTVEPGGRQRAVADAERRGLSIDVISRPHAHGLDEAAAALGLTPGEIVKSLVVKRRDGSFLFALVPGGRRISWPKLRAVVGVNKLSMPDAAIALDATGYPRGAITPLGSSTAWPVFADSRVPPGRVGMGAGEVGYSAIVTGAALLESLGATIADISEPE
ncbi:YbaK/EbsC family protein [Microbacterium sp. STN6]|uniref:aminoacyl-tRNA deacylase n=1 Tax=Microbacterium sp. STN6 TaxID=2995588 RepID=UPI0022609BE2|nr:YbaK/EbsC family protein [Microbacterium sp. STN6]MCX7522326.1 YbaK/EbsC family protein [Microbacterium sp. STN6]